MLLVVQFPVLLKEFQNVRLIIGGPTHSSESLVIGRLDLEIVLSQREILLESLTPRRTLALDLFLRIVLSHLVKHSLLIL